MQKIIGGLLVLVFACSSGLASSTALYASSVVSNSSSGVFDPSAVLGAPDNVVAQFDNVDALTAGFITVAFDVPFENVAGDDLIVHLVDWQFGENEIFEVFASSDGVTYESIGLSGTPNGAATVPIQLGFDLASSSLATASYVSLVNSRIDNDFDWEGPDIDAFQAVSSAPIPEPTTLALFCLGLAGLGLSRRKRA